VHDADAWVAYRRDELCTFLSQLVRIPTFTAEGCLRAAKRVERELERLHVDFEITVVENGTDRRPLLIGWLGNRTPTPALLLATHLDTSPAGPGWRDNPFGGRRANGHIQGRGAVLAKSDVAAYVYALAAAQAVASAEATNTVAVAITSDEGTGGYLGARWLLENRGLRPGRVISTGITRVVAVAHAGCLQADILVTGVPSHAAFADEQCAMHRAVRLAARLLTYGSSPAKRASVGTQQEPTLTILNVNGGQPFSTAVGEVRLRVDRRLTPEEDLTKVETELRSTVAACAKPDGHVPSVEIVTSAEPLRSTDAALEWAVVVQTEAQQVLNEPVNVSATPLYTDARWFGQHGVPTVLFGAGPTDMSSAGVNAPDETVTETDLMAATVTISRLIMRLTEPAMTSVVA
jgi:acetylornithine deacetylase/succinyl-diaminopimelate desuccinylase-like protein